MVKPGGLQRVAVDYRQGGNVCGQKAIAAWVQLSTIDCSFRRAGCSRGGAHRHGSVRRCAASVRWFRRANCDHHSFKLMPAHPQVTERRAGTRVERDRVMRSTNSETPPDDTASSGGEVEPSIGCLLGSRPGWKSRDHRERTRVRTVVREPARLRVDDVRHGAGAEVEGLDLHRAAGGSRNEG